MATKTIKPSGQGGDYESLADWVAGEAGSLSEDIVASIEGDWSETTDTDQVTLNGFTTNGYTITIQTAAEARHKGVWSDDYYKLVASVDNGPVIDVLDRKVRIIGLQVRNTQPSPESTETCVNVRADFSTPAQGDIIFDSCIFRDGRITVRIDEVADVEFRNCIAYGGTYAAFAQVETGGTLRLNNCTAVGVTYGIYNSSGTLIAKNCYASATTAYQGTITKTTCASSDTTGSTGLQNIAHTTANFTNVTAGSEDYHIPSGSALVNVGTDLSGTFTNDVDGVTRSGTWDIGADEYVAELTSVTDDRIILYGVNARVTDTRDIIYDVRASISASMIILYDVLNVVIGSRTLLFNVESPFTSVSDTRAILYSVLKAISGIRIIRFNTQSFVDSDKPCITLIDISARYVVANMKVKEFATNIKVCDSDVQSFSS